MKITNGMTRALLGTGLGLILSLTFVFVSAHQALADGTWETSVGAGCDKIPVIRML